MDRVAAVVNGDPLTGGYVHALAADIDLDGAVFGHQRCLAYKAGHQNDAQQFAENFNSAVPHTSYS